MRTNLYDDLEYIYKFDEKKEKKDLSSKNSNNLDRDAFLKLLTTQLSNQDPLNPIEDREFIAQLAQFTSLEQMQNLNTNIGSLGNEILDTMDMLNANQIQASIQTLKEVINIRRAMESYLDIDLEIVDKGELEAKIKSVQRLDGEDYTEETWRLFEKALAIAEDVATDGAATSLEIEEAYYELITAISGLVKSKVERDE